MEVAAIQVWNVVSAIRESSSKIISVNNFDLAKSDIYDLCIAIKS